MVRKHPPRVANKENIPPKFSLKRANAGNETIIPAKRPKLKFKSQIVISHFESLANFPHIYEKIVGMLSFTDLKTLLLVSKR